VNGATLCIHLMRWHALGRVAGLAIYLVVPVYREQEDGQEITRIVSARAAEKMSSEDIWNNPLTESEKKTLRRHADRQASGDDSEINFDGIPPLTTEQLARMTRLCDRQPKIAVSVRLDRVLEWLKAKGEGHLTRINDILANIMDLERKQSRWRTGAPGRRDSPISQVGAVQICGHALAPLRSFVRLGLYGDTATTRKAATNTANEATRFRRPTQTTSSAKRPSVVGEFILPIVRDLT
jgi:uncharacterized protein (DUF4415 family)